MWAKVTTYLRYTAEERLVMDAASIFKLFGGARLNLPIRVPNRELHVHHYRAYDKAASLELFRVKPSILQHYVASTWYMYMYPLRYTCNVI